MLKIWYGAEPYLISTLKAKEASLIENPSLNVIDNGDELNSETFDACYAMPFMADRKYLVYTAADLKNPYIAKLIADEPENEVRIIVSKYESNLKIAKSLKKEQVQEFKKLADKDIPSFVKYFLVKWPTRIKETDFNYLISRINYSGRTDCDLYTVKNWLKVLFSLPEVKREDIDCVIPEEDSSTAFSLFKYLSDGRMDKYFSLADRLLVTEDAIGLMSLLLSNFRISYKASLVEGNAESEIGVPKYRISSIPKDACYECMTVLQDGVNAVKTGEAGRDVFIRVSADLHVILNR